MNGDKVTRLKRIVENDGSGDIKRVLTVVQSDIFDILSDFMDVSGLNLRVTSETDGYRLIAEANVSRFFDVGKLSD